MLGWLPTVATVVRRTPGRDREAVDGYATKQSIRFVKRTYRASAGAKPARAQSRGGLSAKPAQGRSAGHKITEFYSQSTDGDKGESNRLNGSQIFNEYIIYNKNGPFE